MTEQDQKPTLEYRKHDLKPAPIWIHIVMGVISGIGGCAMGGIAILVFALFHPPPLQQYDTVKNDLTLTAIMLCGCFASLAVLELTWGRRYK